MRSVTEHQTIGEQQGDVTRSGDVRTRTGLAPRAHLLLIVAVALLARLISLKMVQPWPIGPDSILWKSGLEIVNIAQAMVSHHGFSSPFGVRSPPTAWIPPVYPGIMSFVFFLSGIKTGAAAVIILTLQAFFSALTCVPLYGIGRRAFGHPVGLVASWAWAVFPYTVLIPVLFIWETALSAFLLALLCDLCMRLGSMTTLSKAGVGVLWGIAGLTNTALFSVLPLFLCWPFLQSRNRRESVKSLLIVLVCCFVTVVPWLWRDWRSLHALLPIRSNFGEEFWLGNHQGGTGRTAYGLNPPENTRELQQYLALGEVNFVHMKQREAWDFISAHPDMFFRWTLYRISYWWYGKGESAPIFLFYTLMSVLSIAGMTVAFLRRNYDAILLSIAVLLYPVLYYITDIYARYRHPIEPLMTVLGAFLVVDLLRLARNSPWLRRSRDHA
ncbi:MAG TPA: glycosyltransferase family 39 protein [Terriglobales bacterium]